MTQISPVFKTNVGQALGQCRAVSVKFGGEQPDGVLLVYGADFDVDPYIGMFFFPTDTLKLELLGAQGQRLWKRDLGPSVVPGMWFCPVLAFDLDQDGCDEIYFVNNTNAQHPLSVMDYTLCQLDVADGSIKHEIPWPHRWGQESLSHSFRNFIIGGYVNGEARLITAQGTYGQMDFQAWDKTFDKQWEHTVASDDPGARGSHMCPVIDINDDGIDELMWGERCLSFATGEQLFCADEANYKGHSDIIQPILQADGSWLLYTCRESDHDATPRVQTYDARGNILWGDVDQGHMDMGWAARLNDDRSHKVMSIRIGNKTCGPDGRFHQDRDEFVYDASTGKPTEQPFGVYHMLPVDITGDGYHELVRGVPGGDGSIIDRNGKTLATLGGTVALCQKFLNLPGEQILTFHDNGDIVAWANHHATDSPEANARYNHPFYQTNRKPSAVGYNLPVLGGI